MASYRYQPDATAVDGSLASSMKASSLSEKPVLRPAPSSLPTTLTRSFDVQNVPTDAWVQLFGDRIVLGVSQLDGRVGTFLSCNVEESIIDNSINYQVSTLLGKRDDTMLDVYARRVTERIVSLRTSNTEPCPPVLLGISLDCKKYKDPVMFKNVVDVLMELYQEAVKIAAASTSTR